MSRLASYRWPVIALAVLSASTPALAATGAAVARTPEAPANIVVGFVGGFVRHDNPRHGPVKLAQRIQQATGDDTYVRVFENRHRHAAYKTILQLLDTDHDGVLTADEKTRAHIILFGHSWGASAVVLLARELNRAGIPVLLTVQVDSVAKPWQHDSVVPDNVAAAANFYQPHGFIHGRAQITAADAAKTQVLGNYRFDYMKEPVKCESSSWFDHLTPNHAQSECDSRLWTQVEDLVRQRLRPQLDAAALTR